MFHVKRSSWDYSKTLIYQAIHHLQKRLKILPTIFSSSEFWFISFGDCLNVRLLRFHFGLNLLELQITFSYFSNCTKKMSPTPQKVAIFLLKVALDGKPLQTEINQPLDLSLLNYYHMTMIAFFHHWFKLFNFVLRKGRQRTVIINYPKRYKISKIECRSDE